jgi:hypothetical protein
MGLQQQLRRIRSKAWSGWPSRAYRKPRFQERLQAVQEQFANCLEMATPGKVQVISICAGDGRDVIGTLRTHRRRNDVEAWLVELDLQSVSEGAEHATREGLADSLHFLNADATDYTTYRDIAPADIVLACGVWGHVPAQERPGFVDALSQLCRPASMVLWTRGAAASRERLLEIESLFASPEWRCLRTTLTGDRHWAVASYRYLGPQKQLPKVGRIFNFQRCVGR